MERYRVRRNRLNARIAAIGLVLGAYLGWAAQARAELSYKLLTLQSGDQMIAVTGEFTYGEKLDAFIEMVRTSRPDIVTFSSVGGSVYKAMELGRLIRHYELNTAMVDGIRCVSACVMAFLGGVNRMAPAGSIGVHKNSLGAKFTDDPKELFSQAQRFIAETMAYVKEMGANSDLITLALETDADDMRYLSQEEMARFGVTNVAELPRNVARSAPKYDTPSPAPQPIISQLQQRSREFVLALYRNMSQPNNQVLTTLDDVYAETVSYFGEDLSREEVISRIEGFYTRWPIRQYTPKDDSIRVDCDEASLTCTIGGQLQFDAESPERNRRSKGVATFEYLISFHTPQQMPQITSENGRTLERDVAPIFTEPNSFSLGSVSTSR
jgi:hypothetical protein